METQTRPKIQVGLGKIIKNAREKNNMTQRQLADLLHLSHGYIPRIESGITVVFKEDQLLILSQALGIPLDDLREANAFEKRKQERIKPSFPRSYLLGQHILSVMKDKDKNATIGMLERRIVLFNEDIIQLAINFKDFLLSRITLDDKPKNGLRPLIHYFAPWSSEIEEWTPEQNSEQHNQETQTNLGEHQEQKEET